MRWLFLLLVVLNVFYFVWHQQEAPLRAKEVVSLSLYKGSKQEIQLLSETRTGLVTVQPVGNEGDERALCIYLSGLTGVDAQSKVLEAFEAAGLKYGLERMGRAGTGDFVLVLSSSESASATDSVMQRLLNEFNELKYEKKQCQGLRPSDSLHRMAPAPQ
ncbi:hypothetical protein NTD86_05435 [Pseudomonas sp. 7P_10.2_Bac1]|uniref:hypothetical protein n=1 Tax=Pseudomonas sp. 7P_10.2_Bac1 TaxID=2971614 RepID=UPI0021C86ECF|nr:hypothetical protein [Pseudomonas sp. 7P_10.2_Bac1]MCU1726428.1 hypothetical protein [Pseudomonas sp. 7P_10.2_Bac1]